MRENKKGKMTLKVVNDAIPSTCDFGDAPERVPDKLRMSQPYRIGYNTVIAKKKNLVY
jgi:hypothetical protein